MSFSLISLPYQGMHPMRSALESAQCVWSSSERYLPGVHALQSRLEDSIIRIEVGCSEPSRSQLMQGVYELGLDLDSIDIVGVARFQNLYISRKLFVRNASILFDDGASVFDLVGPVTMHSGLVEIQLALVLNRRCPVSESSPWMKGTVLSDVHFRFTTRFESGTLDLIPLDANKTSELGLPDRTEIYLRFKESPLEAKDFECVEAYVDADILTALEAKRGSYLSSTIFSRIAYEIILQTITQGSLELRRLENIASVEGSLYDRLLTGIAKELRMPKADIERAVMDDSQSGRVAAIIQSYCGVRDMSIKSLKVSESVHE